MTHCWTYHLSKQKKRRSIAFINFYRYFFPCTLQSHKLYSNPITCVPQDADTPLKPVALDALEKEKEEMVSLGENEHLEGLFGALRVKGLKVS